jgi:hypothetical protein
VTLTLGIGGFRFRPEDYARYAVQGPVGGPAPMPPLPSLNGMFSVAVRPNIRFTDAWRLSGSVTLRETPLFAEGSLGREIRVAPSLQIRPNEKLNMNAGYTWARLTRAADGSRFSDVSITRLQTQYQFNRSVFVRLIGQYDMDKRSALRHPVTGQPLLIGGTLQAARERGNFQGQALLSYEPSPGTVFFIGYSRVMDGPYGYELGEKSLLEDGFFIKLSYLFRM